MRHPNPIRGRMQPRTLWTITIILTLALPAGAQHRHRGHIFSDDFETGDARRWSRPWRCPSPSQSWRCRPVASVLIKRIVSPSSEADAKFGASVAVDGPYGVVGEPLNDEAGADAGLVLVYGRDTGGVGTWGLIVKRPDGAAGANYGASVSIDGVRVAAGGPLSDSGDGRGWILDRGTVDGVGPWGIRATVGGGIVPPFGLVLGTSVAVHDINNLFGAPDLSVGAALIYRDPVSGGDSITLILPPAQFLAGERFSAAVSLDVNTSAIGIPDHDGIGVESGKVVIYRRDPDDPSAFGDFTLIKVLTASDEAAGMRFGSSLALDGDVLVVGTGDASTTGSAYVFERNFPGLDDWGEIRRLEAEVMATGDEFGFAVTVSCETIVVGAPESGIGSGAIYTFARDAGLSLPWGLIETLRIPYAMIGDQFGAAVARDSRGTTFVGAPFEDDGATSAAGAVYIYEGATYQPIRAVRQPNVLDSANIDLVIVAQQTFVDEADGTNPVVVTVVDREWVDSTIKPLLVPKLALSGISPLKTARVEPGKIRGHSSATGGTVRALPTGALLTSLEGKKAQNQPLVIRKGPHNLSLADLPVVLFGQAEGHQTTGEELTISARSPEEITAVPIQALTWPGRGRNLSFVTDGTNFSTVDFAEPSPDTPWDVSAALTVEVGFTVETLPSVAAHAYDLVERLTQFKMEITTSDKVKFTLFGTSVESVVAVVLDNRHHAALRWDGVDLELILDGQLEDSVSLAPGAAGGGIFRMGGGTGSTQHQGLIDHARWWSVVRTDQELLDNADRPLLADDRDDMQLHVEATEGGGIHTTDPENGYIGDLLGLATWKASGTGDRDLRGEEQPWAFGESWVVPVLLDAWDITYAWHFRGAQRGVPHVGGRPLARLLGLGAQNVSFDATASWIVAEASQSFADFVRLQTVRVTGSASNNRDFEIHEPFLHADGKWRIPLVEPPVTEGTVSAEVETVTAFATSDEIATTVDISGRDITAEDGQSFADVEWQQVVVLAGSASNDGDLVLLVPPFQNAADEWVMRAAVELTAEASVAVTLTQTDALGEYTQDIAGPGPATFTLAFSPTKPVTCLAEGDLDSDGIYVDTAVAVADRILDVMGSATSRDVDRDPRDLGWLDRLHTESMGVNSSFYGTDVPNLSVVLDQILQPLGLHWFISSRDGDFMIATLPGFDLDARLAAGDAFEVEVGAITGAPIDLRTESTDAGFTFVTIPAADAGDGFEVAVENHRRGVATGQVEIQWRPLAAESVDVSLLLDGKLVGAAGTLSEGSDPGSFVSATLTLPAVPQGTALSLRFSRVGTAETRIGYFGVTWVPADDFGGDALNDCFAWTAVESKTPAWGAVQMTYKRNPRRLSDDEIGILVLRDNTAIGRAHLAFLKKDSLLVSYPRDIAEGLKPDRQETFLATESATTTLARARFRDLSGRQIHFRDLDVGLAPQGVEPWFERLALTNVEDPSLPANTVADVVSSTEDVYESTVRALFVGPLPPGETA